MNKFEFDMILNESKSKRLGYNVFNRRYDDGLNTMFDCIKLEYIGKRRFHNLIIDGERYSMDLDCYRKRSVKEIAKMIIGMIPATIACYVILVLACAWAGV